MRYSLEAQAPGYSSKTKAAALRVAAPELGDDSAMAELLALQHSEQAYIICSDFLIGVKSQMKTRNRLLPTEKLSLFTQTLQ